MTLDDAEAIDTALKSATVRYLNAGRVPDDDLRQVAAIALLTRSRLPSIGASVRLAQWAMLDEIKREARHSRPVPFAADDMDRATPEAWLQARQALQAVLTRLSPSMLRILAAVDDMGTPRAACAALGVTAAMVSIARRKARAAIAEAI